MVITLLQHVATIVDISNLPNHGSSDPSTTALNTVLKIVFGITGSMALLMVVIGGFRYVVAHGDPNATAQARNTVLYAVIGLVVTMAAYAIVTFVIKGIS